MSNIEIRSFNSGRYRSALISARPTRMSTTALDYQSKHSISCGGVISFGKLTHKISSSLKRLFFTRGFYRPHSNVKRFSPLTHKCFCFCFGLSAYKQYEAPTSSLEAQVFKKPKIQVIRTYHYLFLLSDMIISMIFLGGDSRRLNYLQHSST